MSAQDLADIVEPLVRLHAFASPEEAVRKLVLRYVLEQIDRYRGRVAELENRYGMTREQFGEYLKARSELLSDGQLGPDEKRRVAKGLMSEEEDWLDWKIASDFLEGWLGLKAEVAA